MKKIGRYEIIRRLGKGGMGSVYKGLVPVIDKVVAIKLLDPSELMADIMGDEKLREIFVFEARTMAGFNQPFLVTAQDFAEDDQGRPFFVMEYICNNLGSMIGEDFQVEKPSRVIRAEKVQHYGRQIMEALAFLHHKKIIHRDIKPQNLLVTDEDRIKICDFGMALVDGVAFSGPDTMQIGSPYYTPPEQRKAPLKVDGRADLYSTAVLLYRMLTGSLPGMQSFSLSQVNPLYDQSWDAFFSKALSWNPDDRFHSAQEMLKQFNGLTLHQDKATPGGEPRMHSTVFQGNCRNEAVNVCSSRARKLFDVNEQDRPLNPVHNQLERSGETVIDKATNLIWQQGGSNYPVSQHDAFLYVEGLNTTKACGLTGWRLPTVNELLTLLGTNDEEVPAGFFVPNAKWLWSCDRHGNHEGWYVNLDMGYTGVMDINCLHYVKAVCSY